MSGSEAEAEANKTSISSIISQDDSLNNNDSAPESLTLHHEHKDEYMEDPLPDLVGNLKIMEEPEPDLTALGLDQEFVLEDFEFQIETEDEDEEDILPDVGDDDSDSDLEFFDATGSSSLAHSVNNIDDGSLDTESENVSVDFLSINNSDNIDNDNLSAAGDNLNVPKLNKSFPPGASSATSKLQTVRQTATKMAQRVRSMVGSKKKITIRSGQYVRVMYHNLEKPYIARVSPAYRFKNFLTLGDSDNNNEINEDGNATPMGLGRLSQSNSITSELGSPIDPNMTAEELAAARAEWQGELTQVEDEINTLRQVLNSKMKRAHELKKKLGITAWSELTSDMGQGIRNVRDSTAVQKIEETLGSVTTAVTAAPLYQKTESAIKATAEKTTSLFGGIGSAVSNKIGALKNTESFRSMEERVTGAVSAVKVRTRMGGSRSGSVQSFDEALREATANQGGAGATNPDGTPANRPNGTPATATTPSAQEEKPLS